MKHLIDMKWYYTFCLVLLLAAVQTASGAVENVDREFEFARGLIELDFADYAAEVVDEVLRFHPDQKNRAKLIQVEILISRRKLEEAKELAATLPSSDPKALAAKLALANAYYATGDRESAKGIYTQFFKKYDPKSIKDKDLLRFYQDAAYRYGKMQERVGEIGDALKGYENVLKTNPEKEIERQLKTEMADLYIKEARKKQGNARKQDLQRAEKLCQDVLWGGTDIWFGKCINILAHIKMLRGDKKGARETIVDYMDMLKKVDERMEKDGLPMELSPMAGARFLLGELYLDQARGLARADDESGAITAYAKALKQFVNVFAKYGGSKWAGDAGDFAEDIKQTLETDYGKQVNIDLGKFRLNAIKSRFRQADQLYIERKYAQAEDEYVKALNAYPETSETGNQLARLGVSFVKQDKDLHAEMLIEYIVERYPDAPEGYLGLLMMGKEYFEQKDQEMYLKAYDAYLNTFPEHDNAPGVLYTLALTLEKEGKEQLSEKYLRQLIDNYPQSSYFLKAVARRGWNSYETGDYQDAVEAFRKYVAEAAPGPEVVRIQFSLADALARMEKYNAARMEFSKLVEWLTPKDNPYAISEEDAKRNRETLDKAEYYVAYTLAMLEKPKDKLDQLRRLAINKLNEYIEKYPESPRAPMAYNIKGKVYLKMGDSEKAAEVYNELASKYPESEAGQGALYQLIKSASEIDEKKVVDDAFGNMIDNPDSFSATQFTQVGEIMMENGLYANAAKAFQQVLNKGAEDRTLLERTLFGLGKSSFEIGNYQEASESLNHLMEKYPDSTYFYDTKFIMGRSYLEQEKFDEARAALRDVFKYAQKATLRKRADYQLAMIEKAAGNVEKALAALQRIVLLTDSGDTDLRPVLEKSYLESIELFNQLEQYEDVVETGNQYLKDFPQGEYVEKVRDIRQEARLK